MNRDEPVDRDGPLEEAFESLVTAYQDALESGATPAPLDETSIPADLAPRVRSAQACLALLDQARRGRPRRTEDSASGRPHGAPELATDAPTSAAPRRVGRFRIERELGRGGYGVVFLAYDEGLARQVALKVPRPEVVVSPELSRRFLREAQLAGSLEHPNLVAVYEVGHDGPFSYIASAYCDGPTLARWLEDRGEPVPVRTAAALIAALADGVEEAHRQGILHRDIKPSNVLLAPRSSSDIESCPGNGDATLTPKLTDFGLAKLQDIESDATRTGALLGTPSYMAPEQAHGQSSALGPATDVYGLGAILYELLTGIRAFQGAGDADTLRRIVQDEPTAVRHWRTQVPRDLEAVCMKCLEKRPADRYASAGALAADVRRYLRGEPTLARPLGLTRKLLRKARRRPAAAALVACLITSVVLLVAGLAWHSVTLSAALTESDERLALADKLRLAAEESRRVALTHEDLANRHLYASRMRNAYELWDQEERRLAQKLVSLYEPPSPLAAQRGFEWFHLQRRLHSEQHCLLPNQGQVYGVAFAPDGHELASAGQDGTIKIWDPACGKLLDTLHGHRSCVNQVAYAPDGRTLASVSCDHTLKFWSTQSRELLATCDAHPDEVRCLAFSPDGSRLVTGGKASPILLWDAATRQVIRTREIPDENLDILTWLDDHSVLVPTCGGADGRSKLEIWNVDTDERQMFPIGNSDNIVRSIVVRPETHELVVGLRDGTVQTVEGLTPKLTVRHNRWSSTAYTVDYLASRQWVAAGFDDGAIRVYSWPELGFKQAFAAHDARVQALAFSPRGDLLASASWDGTVKLWSLDFERLPKLELAFLNDPNVHSSGMLGLSPDTKYVACFDERQRLSVVELATGHTVAVVSLPDDASPTRFSPDSATLFGYSRSARSLWSWEWSTEPAPTNLPLPERTAGATILPLDGQCYISIPADTRKIQMFAAGDAEPWWECENCPAPFRAVLSCDSGVCAINRLIGSKGIETPLCDLLRWKTRQAACTIDKPVEATDAEASTVAIRRPDGRFAVLDAASGRETLSARCEAPMASAAFSPDGRTLATGDTSGRVQLWNVPTGSVITQFNVDKYPIEILRFSTDGQSLTAVAIEPNSNPAALTSRQARLYVWSGTGER